MQQNENNTVTFDEGLLMIIGFVGLATIVFFVLSILTHKEAVNNTTMIVTKIDTLKTTLDKPEYFIQCNNDSILTYRSHTSYKIGDTFKIQ